MLGNSMSHISVGCVAVIVCTIVIIFLAMSFVTIQSSTPSPLTAEGSKGSLLDDSKSGLDMSVDTAPSDKLSSIAVGSGAAVNDNLPDIDKKYDNDIGTGTIPGPPPRSNPELPPSGGSGSEGNGGDQQNTFGASDSAEAVSGELKEQGKNGQQQQQQQQQPQQPQQQQQQQQELQEQQQGIPPQTLFGHQPQQQLPEKQQSIPSQTQPDQSIQATTAKGRINELTLSILIPRGVTNVKDPVGATGSDSIINTYLPQDASIVQGTKVKWLNMDPGTMHGLVIHGQDGTTNNPIFYNSSIPFGGYTEFAFNKVGQYGYSDPWHPFMKGTLKVINSNESTP